MNNPFELIEARLCNIENLILDLKDQPKQAEPSEPQEQHFLAPGAADFLGIVLPTIYSKVSRGEVPYMKRGKRLHFSKTELMDYLKGGRRLTNAEIEAEAHTYLKKPRGKK